MSTDAKTIGDVAREAGVNRETLRYYERRGLVVPSARSQAGYRLYPAEAPRVVRFIKSAQALGFSLDEIEDLLSLRESDGRTCAQVRKMASARLEDIEHRIEQLDAVRTRLAKLVRACSRTRKAPTCPILDCLDTGGTGNA